MNPFQFLRKDIFKDLSFLMGGTFIAQLIPILLQPILKRVFTVEEFGIFDIYFRSVGLLAIVFSLKYEKAIVLCEKKEDSIAIYIGVILLGIISFVFTEIILLLLSSFGVVIFNFPKEYSLIIFLIPLSALFFSISLASQLMFIRQKRFVASSSLKIFRRSSEGLIQVFAGFSGQFWGLTVGESFGNLIAALAGFLRLKKESFNQSPRDLIERIKRNAKNYSELPKFAFASNLLNAFVLSALSFQIFAKFSIQEVGYAELTQRMLTVPSALIGVSLGQLILQRFSAAYNEKTSVLNLFKGFLIIGILVAIPFFASIFLWGPEIFGWVFGPEWKISGIYAKSLIISSSLLVVISPLGQVLFALRKIKTNSFWEIGKFIVIGSLFFIKFDSIVNYLFIYNLLLIFIYATYLIIIVWNIHSYEKSISN